MPQPVYGSEMRFGVVMYGGVSLAIYINGVSNELFELACATPLDPAGVGALDPASTREIYRRLSLLAGSPALRRAYAQAIAARPEGAGDDVWQEPDPAGLEPMRFVIDVISGTSAGGINGVFLAKALANGEAFSSLADLWIDEGDIGRLLNDDKAYEGLPAGVYKPPGGPVSLLSSDRMFLKLHDAVHQMQPLAGPGSGATGPALVDELDLFVTATDIDGAAVGLRLFDKVVYERRYRQRFHFSVPSRVPDAAPAQDFAAVNHPFLAFAARCTSSFPFAFEPMTLARARKLLPEIDEERVESWRPYFDGLAPEALAQGRYAERPYGDGGYLDNKPFSYVVEALSERFGDVPAVRKLIYVEPDPETLDPAQADRTQAPNAIVNSLNALIGIPHYETIREDLRTILLRNRQIERVERILRLSENDVEQRRRGFANVRCDDGKVPEWSKLPLDHMVDFYGEAFLPYRRLRVYAVTDWLALQLAAAFGLDAESDRGYALRAVVRAWRERHFADNPTDESKLSVNAFLDRFDFDYRLRRLAFLLRRIDQFTRMLTAAPGSSCSDLEKLIADKVARVFGALDPLACPEQAAPMVALLRQHKQDLRASYRKLLDLRRSWAAGGALRWIVPADPLLAPEVVEVLDHLIGAAPPGSLPTLRCTDGSRSRMPADAVWLQSDSPAYSLQDSVMERVNHWIEALDGHPALRLWASLEAATEAMRVDGGEAATTPVGQLLFAVWRRLGSPRLAAVAVDEQPPRYEAQLVVEREPATDVALLHPLRMLLGEYFLGFDSFDQTRFTLYYGTSTGEPATIDVVRVSPLDALSLRSNPQKKPKLAGTKLAHFGAFLEKNWRRNDIMWGRLDGAERLVQTVLPAAEDAAVRTELVRLAQGRILKQTLGRDASEQLSGLLVDALRESGGAGKPEDQLKGMLARLDLGDAASRARLAGALTGLLDSKALSDYVSSEATFNPQPQVDTALANAARAVTISGRMLEGISQDALPSTKPLVRWIARLGLAMQGAVAVSVPGALWQRVWSHLMLLLYGFEVLLLGAALLFGDAGLRSTAVSAFLATLALHLLTLVLRDFMRESRWWLKGLAALIAVSLVGASALGVYVVYEWGPAVLCGPGGGDAAAQSAPWFCAPDE